MPRLPRRATDAQSLAVKINGQSIADYSAMTVDDATRPSMKLLFRRELIIAGRILKEIAIA